MAVEFSFPPVPTRRVGRARELAERVVASIEHAVHESIWTTGPHPRRGSTRSASDALPR